MVVHNFAYVKFRECGSTAIVRVNEIKNFDQSTHHEDKVYYVLWRQPPKKVVERGDTSQKTSTKKLKRTLHVGVSSKNKDGVEPMDLDNEEGKEFDYYRAQILLLEETKEKLEERIQNGPRIRVRKLVESSVEEASDEEESVPLSLKQKFAEEKVAKKATNAHISTAKKTALDSILQEKMVKRKTFFPCTDAPKKETTPNTGVSASASNCGNCMSLKKKVAELEKEKRTFAQELEELRTLNRRLQEEILNKVGPLIPTVKARTQPPSSTSVQHTTPLFKAPQPRPTPIQTPPPAEQLPTPTVLEDKYVPDDGQQSRQLLLYVHSHFKVSLGAGILIPADKMDAITGQVKNSLMVKNLAVAVFGTALLRESSVTGQTCNRYKDHEVRPALDSAKLQAVKGDKI
nr:BEN domain-containing protein 5-like [Lytechinus pictus]